MSTRGPSFSSSDNDIVIHDEFMAFLGDDESISVVRRWAERQGFPAAAVQPGGVDMFAQMMESSAPPKMAMVDINGQADPVGIAERLLSLCGADCKLILIGSANDVELYRKMLKIGVTDYLVKILSDETLNQALAAALQESSPTRAENRNARIILVIGTRGGVGASTIAVNAGWLLAHELKLTCALLDLDLQFGTSALALDLEPGRGLRAIINAPDRVDSLMIASSLVPESEQFMILGAEEPVDEYVQVDSAAITALLKEMKGNFDCIIVDLPRHLLATQKRLLATAHEIVIVAELSLAGVRDTLRIKKAINDLGCAGILTFVASRVSSAREGQLDIEAFEKGAQVKIDITFPEDPKTVTAAANSGKAIGDTARQSPAAKAIASLVQKLSGIEVATATKNKGFFKKWFGQKKPPSPQKEKKSSPQKEKKPSPQKGSKA